MNALNSLIIFLLISLAHVQAKSQIYTDDREFWSPKGKFFNVVCLGDSPDKGSGFDTYRNVKLKALNRKTGTMTVTHNDADISLYGGICYFEQTDKRPVARSEFLESMHKASCKLGSMPFNGVDVRILSRNDHFYSLKRLTDGQVWIVSKRLCSFSKVLPKLNLINPDEMEALPALPEALPEKITPNITKDMGVP